MKALVVIPTYNEQNNIEALLKAIFDLHIGLHVLVVDDDSPDGTAFCVKKLQKHHPRQLHLLNRMSKQGLGSAYIVGFSWALDHGYEYICSFDADFSHLPADLNRIFFICMEQQADLVIGSRYIPGSIILDWPKKRFLLSYCANFFVRSVTGMAIKDATSGFVCYRRELLQTILATHITSLGYGFPVEIKFLAHKRKAKWVEMPILFRNRLGGASKLNLLGIWESFLDLLKMRWYR